MSYSHFRGFSIVRVTSGVVGGITVTPLSSGCSLGFDGGLSLDGNGFNGSGSLLNGSSLFDGSGGLLSSGSGLFSGSGSNRGVRVTGWGRFVNWGSVVDGSGSWVVDGSGLVCWGRGRFVSGGGVGSGFVFG